ncbi:MAG: hypothetical protein NC131_10020 [Roseburia sp.]|nr:hypothetical protein [Roseburia sp.]
MASKKQEIIAEASASANPLMAALRENDRKNLFKTNVTTAFIKTGFQLFDYFFGAVINIHDNTGKIIRQEPRVGQAAGTFNLFVGNTGTGKAQPVDTKIPTPNGWKAMGDLQVGDIIFGDDGSPVKVTGVYPQGEKDTYGVMFLSGRYTVCSENHLWSVFKDSGNGYQTMSLHDIMKSGQIHLLHFPKLGTEAQFESQEVPFDPYVVGLAYGRAVVDLDGRISFPTRELADKAARRLGLNTVVILPDDQYGITPHEYIRQTNGSPMDLIDIRQSAGDNDTSQYLSIPSVYMVNDVTVRYELLSGIIDSSVDDTFVDQNGYHHFRCRLTSRDIARELISLARSLGMDGDMDLEVCKALTISGHDIESQMFTAEIIMDNAQFNYTREYDRPWPMRRVRKPGTNIDRIVSINKLGRRDCVCIQVDSPMELYLTEDYIITHNTTLTAQIAANIIRQFNYANTIHFDGEERFDVSRCETITRLPAYFFDGSNGGERYMIRSGMIGLDVIQEMVVKTYVSKMKLKKELMVPSGFKDEFGKDVMIFQPTVIIVDSMTTVMSETFSPDSTKEAADAEKMRGNTEGARDAKTLKGFFKDILPLCKEANIIVYGINHLNTNMSMNAFIPVAKQQNYLNQDESIPGGKTMLYYPFNIVKLTAKPGDDFTDDVDGFAGHMVMIEPIKSSSNQSGNKRKGVSFEMVFSHKQGFDSLRTMIMYGRERGIIEGNKTRMKFKEDDSFTFSLKNIYKEKDEKPIWESIKKFITPTLLTHLSFVEPMESGFDDRSMDY